MSPVPGLQQEDGERGLEAWGQAESGTDLVPGGVNEPGSASDPIQVSGLGPSVAGEGVLRTRDPRGLGSPQLQCLWSQAGAESRMDWSLSREKGLGASCPAHELSATQGGWWAPEVMRDALGQGGGGARQDG